MRSKVLFLAIVSFWLVMNYLLWRSQWGPHSGIGNSVPVEVVWDKILTAPDSSALDLFDHEKKIGVCHWLANVGSSSPGLNRNQPADYAPDGMVEEITGYSLTFEGNALLPESNHVRFEASLDLSTNRAWKYLHVRVSLQPTVWDARAAGGTEWQAHEDWMQFGHSKVRVYRLETDFLGQHVHVFISRAGEVLW